MASPDVTSDGREVEVVLHTIRYLVPERLEGYADNLDEAMRIMESFVDENSRAPVAIQVGGDYWRVAKEEGESGVQAAGEYLFIEWVRCDRSEVADELKPGA